MGYLYYGGVLWCICRKTMTAQQFKAVGDISEVEEGDTVRIGERDIIHRPEGAVTGEVLEWDIDAGILHVAKGDGYQPFTTSEADGYVAWQGGKHNERVFVAE